MIFFSYTFILFMSAVYLLYWNINVPVIRKVLLFSACACFHWYFAGPAGVVPVVFLAIGTYFVALSRQNHLCVAWIIVCISALVFYKYTHFIALNFISMINSDIGVSIDVGLSKILPVSPPLGISFFVFEFVHYLIEVMRNHAPIRSPLQFGIFTIFWPSLVAGPVKRYQQFSGALAKGVNTVHGSDIAVGLYRVCVGVTKKFIADGLTILINEYGGIFDYLSIESRWLIFVGIGIRILFDFSGYSDMGIGFSRMFGIRLPENFAWPYLAGNITEFWRRWHISLSSWIRDYVYIPLGGNRSGPARAAFNAFLAMALCGLWHGAAWNFMVWGIYHGAGLVIHSTFKKMSGDDWVFRQVESGRLRSRVSTLYSAPWVQSPQFNHTTNIVREHWIRGLDIVISYFVKISAWAFTMIFVLFGWLIFFYPVPKAIHMFRLLFVG